jgi:hypothetical protein
MFLDDIRQLLLWQIDDYIPLMVLNKTYLQFIIHFLEKLLSVHETNDYLTKKIRWIIKWHYHTQRISTQSLEKYFEFFYPIDIRSVQVNNLILPKLRKLILPLLTYCHQKNLIDTTMIIGNAHQISIQHISDTEHRRYSYDPYGTPISVKFSKIAPEDVPEDVNQWDNITDTVKKSFYFNCRYCIVGGDNKNIVFSIYFNSLQNYYWRFYLDPSTIPSELKIDDNIYMNKD